MICTGCYREVPDLVGPRGDLCPECFGVDPEHLVPSLHAHAESKQASSAEFWEDFAEDFLAYLDLDVEAFESWDVLDEELDPPFFGGKPRF